MTSSTAAGDQQQWSPYVDHRFVTTTQTLDYARVEKEEPLSSYPPTRKTPDAPSREPTPSSSFPFQGSEDALLSDTASPSLWMAVLGTSLGISLGLLALTGGLIVYIFINRVFFSSPYVFVNVPNNRILLIGTLIAKIPPLLTPVLMGIVAYGLAYDWIIGSQRDGENTLTPEQYSLLLHICSSAGLESLWDGLAYRWRTKRHPTSTPRIPPILSRAAMYLTVITLAVNGVSVMDTVFHDGVAPAAFSLLSSSTHPLHAFGRQINQTICNNQGSSFLTGPSPCASVRKGNAGTFLQGNAAESSTTAANASSVHEVVMVDNVALLLDKQRGQNTFMAKTIGWYSTCTPVSQQCNLRAISNVQAPYGCIDYPAFKGDLSGKDGSGGFDAAQVFPFNASGTRDARLGLGAWSQPLEFGVTFTTDSCRSLHLRFCSRRATDQFCQRPQKAIPRWSSWFPGMSASWFGVNPTSSRLHTPTSHSETRPLPSRASKLQA